MTHVMTYKTKHKKERKTRALEYRYFLKKKEKQTKKNTQKNRKEKYNKNRKKKLLT